MREPKFATIEQYNEMKKAAFDLKQQMTELAKENAELKAKLGKFKFYGTDGCRGQNDTCQGRFQLYYTTDECIQCAPGDYKTRSEGV